MNLSFRSIVRINPDDFLKEVTTTGTVVKKKKSDPDEGHL